MAIPPQRNPSTDPGATASAWAVEHAKDLGIFTPGASGVEVVLVTDPWSVWCWGFEPVRRAIQHRFPSVTFKPLVGGMFARMPDPAAVGFNVERFFTVVQRTTGMPIRADATRADRPRSTYPACIHVATVRLLRPDLETTYLRRLREAIYLEARNVSRPEVAMDVAEAVGIPRGEFQEALASGEPEREFRETLARLETNGIQAYPTYLVRAGERIVRLEGFQTLPSLLTVVEEVSRRIHPSLPAPQPEAVLVPGERIATREVAEVLDVSIEEAYDRLRALEKAGVAARDRHPNGDVWRRVA